MKKHNDVIRTGTIIIGGGQAGLAVAYYLTIRGLQFEVLDASARVGDAWRNRWDSLRLFSPPQYDGLPGLPFPSQSGSAPTKDEMADYLESYATCFRLHVRSGMRVESLTREGERFVVYANGQRFEADQVVVAMSNYQVPKFPEFAGQLNNGIVQLHSHAYRNPSQLQDGPVLVVGVGNSGADIGMEVARTHRTLLSGKESGFIPVRIDGLAARFLVAHIVRFIGHHVMTVNTPMGRKRRPALLSKAAPLIRVKPKDLVEAGIERVARVMGTLSGLPLLADGSTLDVKNVIWCTGYRNGFSWINLPVLDKDGRPAHDKGLVPQMPGMYFVGLHFLYSMTSATVGGVGRDAVRIAEAIQKRNIGPSSSAREEAA